MDVSEIKDEKSLKAWLESLPARIGEDEARRWAVLLAHRAAMRVLPEYILARAEELFRAPNERALLALRFNLVCAVLAKSDDRDLQQKAQLLASSEPYVSEFSELAQSRYPSTFAHAFAAIAASACSSSDCAADAATALECADVVLTCSPEVPSL